MNTSETISEIASALAAAQGQLSDPVKGRTASTGTFSYSYASLPDLLPAVRAVLSSNGIALIQECEDVCNTRLIHKSGEWIETVYPLDLDGGRLRGAQARGSAVTYARRYSLMSLLGLAAEDDDGAGSTRSTAPPARPAPPAPREIKRSGIKDHAAYTRALPVALGELKKRVKLESGSIVSVVDRWLSSADWGSSSEMSEIKLTGLISFIESAAGQSKLSAWMDSASSDLLDSVPES